MHACRATLLTLHACLVHRTPKPAGLPHGRAAQETPSLGKASTGHGDGKASRRHSRTRSKVRHVAATLPARCPSPQRRLQCCLASPVTQAPLTERQTNVLEF